MVIKVKWLDQKHITDPYLSAQKKERPTLSAKTNNKNKKTGQKFIASSVAHSLLSSRFGTVVRAGSPATDVDMSSLTLMELSP